MPADTNAYGDIFGRWLMSQVDIAGSILAIREAEGRVATVAIKEFRFLAPVSVGDLISCYAEIRRRGQSSITVHVVAEACHQLDATDPNSQRLAITCAGNLSRSRMVALPSTAFSVNAARCPKGT